MRYLDSCKDNVDHCVMTDPTWWPIFPTFFFNFKLLHYNHNWFLTFNFYSVYLAWSSHATNPNFVHRNRVGRFTVRPKRPECVFDLLDSLAFCVMFGSVSHAIVAVAELSATTLSTLLGETCELAALRLREGSKRTLFGDEFIAWSSSGLFFNCFAAAFDFYAYRRSTHFSSTSHLCLASFRAFSTF